MLEGANLNVLQAPQEIAHAPPDGENRVGDELTGPVIRRRAAALGRHDLDAQVGQLLERRFEVGGFAVLASVRDDAVMLQ